MLGSLYHPVRGKKKKKKMADMHYLIFSELVSLRHKVVFDPVKGRRSHCIFFHLKI